jgi:hypothetical protein
VANAEEAKQPHRRASVPTHVPHQSDPVVVFRIGPDITWDSHTRERIKTVLDHGDRGMVICDVAAIRCPTLGTLDVLARLQLAVRRRGWDLTLHGAHSELRALLALAGLIEVLHVVPNSPSGAADDG